jgi:hypothetical protein
VANDPQRELALWSQRSIVRCSCGAHCFVLLLLFTAISLLAAPPREQDLKAAFIFNFAQFVEWPVKAFPDSDAVFVIGVAGSVPMEEALTELTRGEKVRGHAIEVRKIRNPTEAAQAHILYIGPTESSRWPEFARRVRSSPVLTVSDTDGFCRTGGIIELFNKENKIRFRANPASAKQAELVLSSKLLRLAEIIGGTGD